MQQTPNYKLNLIETSDMFSPNPLNENAQKLEAALASKTDADQAAAAHAALTSSLAAEAKNRADADSAEAKARANADSAEAKARADGDSAEAKARAAADTTLTNGLAAANSAISAETAARKSADNALDQRLKVFEAKRFVIGTYTGTGETTHDFSLGFTPKLFMACPIANLNANKQQIVWTGNRLTVNTGMTLEIIGNGFRAGQTMNESGKAYTYLAID